MNRIISREIFINFALVRCSAAQIVNICVQIYNEITFSATHKIRQINNCLTSRTSIRRVVRRLLRHTDTLRAASHTSQQCDRDHERDLEAARRENVVHTPPHRTLTLASC